jgi:ubiquinone/menaquinone biosynthesis C-methylase UbiE
MYEQLKKINPDDYVACDCAKELLSKHPGRIKKVVCNLEKDWPFEDESFDLLSAFFLLEHIEDIEHFFNEAYRILKTN